MTEILKTLLLAGDKFTPEIHSRQPGFTYSACGPFTKNKETIQKFKRNNTKKGDSRHIYQNELDKACFQQDMAYGDFKDLPRRTASDKVLFNKAFNIGKNPKYDGYQRRLASMVYKFFDKRSALFTDKPACGSGVKSKIMSNQQLTEELHKPVIRKFFLKILLLKTLLGMLILWIWNYK